MRCVTWSLYLPEVACLPSACMRVEASRANPFDELAFLCCFHDHSEARPLFLKQCVGTPAQGPAHSRSFRESFHMLETGGVLRNRTQYPVFLGC